MDATQQRQANQQQRPIQTLAPDGEEDAASQQQPRPQPTASSAWLTVAGDLVCGGVRARVKFLSFHFQLIKMAT